MRVPVVLVLALAVAGDTRADNGDPGAIQVQIDHRDLRFTAESWFGAPAIDVSVLTMSPVEDGENSGYGWRDHPTLNRRKFHHGTDYNADRGAPVLAAGDGVVVFASRYYGYGKLVEIDHGGGVVTRYAHLQNFDVKKGDTVSAGSQIGKVGSTGRTTGAHLHFEVRIEGRSVDPKVALAVAEIQRTDPMLGAIAAKELAPEIQNKALDAHDETNRKRARRERRPQILW
jgi:murein DD-endopeptidase MepM/ murein hydrolase activator NlpD